MKKASLKSLRGQSPRKECVKHNKDGDVETEGASLDLSLPPSCSRNCCVCPHCFRREHCPYCHCTCTEPALESPKRKSTNFFNTLRKKFSTVKQLCPHETGTSGPSCSASSGCSSYLKSHLHNPTDVAMCSRVDRNGLYRSKSAERPKSRQPVDTACQTKSTQVKKRSNTSSLPRKSRTHMRQSCRARTLKASMNACESDSDDEFVAGRNKRTVKDQTRSVVPTKSVDSTPTRRLNDLSKPFDGYGHASSPKCNDLLVADDARTPIDCQCSDKSSSASKSGSDGDMDVAPATLSRDLSSARHYDQVKERDREPWSLTKELVKLAKHGWYWGPINRVEAEEKLTNQPDGAFLVRDSSDERYLLSLSFRSYGRTLHTRIEHCNGVFSFYAQPESEGYCSIVDLINHSMNDSQTGVFYYSRARTPGSPSFPVRLTKPVSRFSHVRSLQYLCRFVIRQTTRVDHIQKLPLPTSIKGWLQQKQY